MGYTTIFTGRYELDEFIEKELVEYINNFCQTRRMKRDVKKIVELFPNWADMCYDGILGKEGEFFVHDIDNFGQIRDKSIVDYNNPPRTQPGLWCKWKIVEKDIDGKIKYCLVWDGMEKFYDYIEWLQYLIDNFFKDGTVLNGVTLAVGEETNDAAWIVVVDNRIYTIDAMGRYAVNEVSKLISTHECSKEIFKDIKKTPGEIYNTYWNW